MQIITFFYAKKIKDSVSFFKCPLRGHVFDIAPAIVLFAFYIHHVDCFSFFFFPYAFHFYISFASFVLANIFIALLNTFIQLYFSHLYTAFNVVSSSFHR